MKRILVAAAAVLLLASCSEGAKEHEPVDDGKLSVESLKEDNGLIYGTGGEVELRVDSKKAWSACLVEEEAGSWVTLDRKSAADGSQRIVVRTLCNDSGEERTATVRVANDEDEHSFQFTQRRNVFRRQLLKERRVSNSFGFKYDRNGIFVTRVLVILPVPESNMYQDIDVWSSRYGELMTASDGHTRYIRRDVSGGDIPASGDVILEESFTIRNYSVEVDVDAIASPVAVDAESDLYREYTARNGDIINPDLPALRSIADGLWRDAGGDMLRYARICYEYVAEKMLYLNAYTGLHTLEKILADGGGDCGNQATVFISLLRNKKIPARHVVMVRTDGTCHVRAEFYLGGYGWIPVDVNAKNMDPSGDYFGRVFSDEIVVNNNIDFDILLDGTQKIRVPLLQTYLYGYWYNGAEPKVEACHRVEEIDG